jgi:hypothetical protein
MKIKEISPKSIAKKMSDFSLFDADLTDTAIVVEDDGKIIAFAQFDKKAIRGLANGAVIFEIESKIKGSGRMMAEWMKENYDIIQVKNSGQDSWGFWEKMSFSKIEAKGYYAEWEWEFES